MPMPVKTRESGARTKAGLAGPDVPALGFLGRLPSRGGAGYSGAPDGAVEAGPPCTGRRLRKSGVDANLRLSHKRATVDGCRTRLSLIPSMSEFRDRNSVGIPASIDDMAGRMNAGHPCSSAWRTRLRPL